MAESNVRGPLTSMGSLEVQSGTAANIEPMDGPGVMYQDAVFPDLRFVPFGKDGTAPGRVAAFAAGINVFCADNVPQKGGSTLIAASNTATTALPMLLATVGVSQGLATACSIAVGVPIIPVGTTVATNVIALDFGFATGSTVANSSAVYTLDNRYFRLGQWVIIGNVANAAFTASFITQVQALHSTNTTGVFVSPVPPATMSCVGIGQANLYGSELLPPATQFGPAAASANAHAFGGAMGAGLARVYNPREMLARNLYLQAVTSDNFSAIVNGWDVWGVPMSELITMAAQTVVAGKKAFKYIGSIVNGTTSTDNISVGLGDTFGFPIRCDEWEQTEICWNGSSMTNNNGFTAAALATPSLSTTGDVRGTVQVSTAVVTGVIATAVSALATNGTGRLSMLLNVGIWNQVYATPLNTVPMFGVAQSTSTT